MKILLEYAGHVYRFLDIQLEKDGSVYVSLDRKPRDPANRLTRKPGDTAFKPASQPEGPRKLSYHTTGRVNYHGLISATSGFFEPLVDLTGPNSVLLISVPSCPLLDRYEAVIDPHLDCFVPIESPGRFTVCLTFAPSGYSDLAGVRFDFGNFVLLVHPVSVDLSPPSPEHFVYAAAPSLFENQRLGKNEAELAYVQGEGGAGIVVTGPNGRGEYTMYFSVVMRTPPRVRVDLTNPKDKFELINNEHPHKLTFRIHGKSALVRSTDLRPYIRRIELDAEL